MKETDCETCGAHKMCAGICAILHRNRSFLTTDADAYFLCYCFIYVIRMRKDWQRQTKSVHENREEEKQQKRNKKIIIITVL